MESKQEQNQIIKNIQELEQHWDAFSEAYTNIVSKSMSPAYVTMITMMDIETADSILETAVGPGILIPHLINRVKKGAKIHLTDLSSDFLAITQKRLELYREDPTQNLYSFNTKELPKFCGPTHFDNLGVTLQKANSENLVDFQDSSIDAYISSLCLQLTENPQKMIKESFRVLRNGGRVCMSVWGDEDKSQLLSLVPNVFKKFNVNVPQERSNFHLNDRNKLIEMFEKEGFTNITCWNQFLPSRMVSSPADVEKMFNMPMTKSSFDATPEEDKESIKQAIRQGFQEIFNNKQANGLDLLIICATK